VAIVSTESRSVGQRSSTLSVGVGVDPVPAS